MHLEHYSPEPVRLSQLATAQVPVVEAAIRGKSRFVWKPKGLWVSVKGRGDWPAYVKSDFGDTGTERLRYVHDVGVPDWSRLLVLRSVSDITVMVQRYGVLIFNTFREEWSPCWAEIAKDYAGVVIAPYQGGIRNNPDFGWYYTWDCASGCIWDPSAIVISAPYLSGLDVPVDTGGG